MFSERIAERDHGYGHYYGSRGDAPVESFMNPYDEPSYIVAQIALEPRPVIPTGREVNMRQGYFDGLGEFANKHSIDPHELGIQDLDQCLKRPDFFVGFVNGLEWQDLEIPDDQESSGLDHEAWNKMWELRLGYKFGFSVKCARDLDIVLPNSRIPSNFATYHAFMSGLEGLPRTFYSNSPRTLNTLERYYETGFVVRLVVPSHKLEGVLESKPIHKP